MIRRSLADAYIKALILKGFVDSAIVDLLDALVLDYPGKSYVPQLRRLMRIPEILRLKEFKRHKETRNYLIKEGLYAFFEKGADMRQAFDILEKPKAKEFAETMLISNAPLPAVAFRLSSMFMIRSCTPKAVHRYKTYFFNTDAVDRSELRALLQYRYKKLLLSDNPELRLQGELFKKGQFLDARIVAADLPNSPFSSLIAQLQMGIVPKSVELGELMRSTEMLAHVRLNESLGGMPFEFDRRAANLITVLKGLRELKEATQRPEEELNKQLQKIKLKTEKGSLPLLNDLSKGNHTVDLVATPVSGEKDDSKH